jgi:adenine-specific DNA-methyltransferase
VGISLHLLEHADLLRSRVAPSTNREHKSAMGQFMTGSRVARFMASLFEDRPPSACRLLDPGAGIGALSCAFLDRWSSGGLSFESVDLHAFELDPKLISLLSEALSGYQRHLNLRQNVVLGDFIAQATTLFGGVPAGFTHAILNPPYKKINSDSRHRLMLRRAGIETVNLYSAFVALSVSLVAPGGQIVAIVPRSFCNGPYYRPFREFLLNRVSIARMHLFESRSKTFQEDGVLQENVILHLVKEVRQKEVKISTSTDDRFHDLAINCYPMDRIVFPGDSEGFIHIPTSPGLTEVELSPAVRYYLEDVGLSVSTGPVVDFRMREYTRKMPETGTVPLLYPGHFTELGVEWPRSDFKKPNAIVRNAETEKWLYPSGHYCVVRRFTSKEERRRIVARVVSPDSFGDATMVGFENHLNVFHEQKRGIPERLAHGLAAFLNMAAVDEQFRRFNGHTQVNATDLRTMKYPSREALLGLGDWVMGQASPFRQPVTASLELLTA